MPISLFARVFGSSDVDSVAEELAVEFSRHCPLKDVENAKALARAIELVLARAKGLKRSNAWNAAHCVRVGNSLRWRLTELGYPREVAEETSRNVAVTATYVGRKSKHPR